MADNTVRVEGNYNAPWLSLNSAQIKPNYRKELYKTYGKSFGIFDFLNIAGQTELVSNRTVKLFEQGNLKANITTSTAITTGSVGADITFKIAAGDYDTNGNPTVRLRQAVLIPQKYQPSAINTPQVYQVVSRSGSAGDYTFTARPFNSTVAQIAVEVPSGTTLTLGMLQHAPGTDQPAGTTQAVFERSFNTTILKEHIGFEGGFLSHKQYEQVLDEQTGKVMGYFNKALIDTEFLLDDQLDQYIFMGQPNDNASLVQTSNFSGSQKVLSGTGIWQFMDAQAQQLWYSLAYEHDDYVTAKNLFESQGVMDDEVNFMMGSKLYDDTDQADRDFLKEYSGGTDLYYNMNEVGFRAQKVVRNGVSYNKIKLKSFSNPFSFGNDEYELSEAGFMIPTTKSKVSINGKEVRLNNLTLGYLGFGGENRTRVLGHISGMNGFQEYKPLNGYDGMTVEMLTEPMLIFTNINQCVQVRKQS